MKIPPALEAKILATPGVVEYTRKPEKPAREKPLIEPRVFQDGGKLVIDLPVRTASEINGRDWRARSRRTKEAWKAMSKLLGPHLGLLVGFGEAYQFGKTIRVTFTRIGGRMMDRSNLPTAVKGCEDAIAFFLGADDGAPNWLPAWQQEPGPACGVRIELEVVA